MNVVYHSSLPEASICPGRMHAQHLRLDEIFGSGDVSPGVRIQDVIEGYAAWAKQRKLRVQRTKLEAAATLRSRDAVDAILRQLSRVKAGELGADDFVKAALLGELPLGPAVQDEAADTDGDELRLQILDARYVRDFLLDFLLVEIRILFHVGAEEFLEGLQQPFRRRFLDIAQFGC